jgi:hypothetical protein
MSEPIVTARPIVTSRWVLSVAAAIVIAFLVIAATLTSATTLTDGVSWLDRVSIFGLGLLIAAIVATPAWPRMTADADGVRTRGFVGGCREVPWELVHAVEFPPRARWARLTLADEETITLFAVQRADGTASVEVMDRLRALHRAHPSYSEH